MRSLVFSHDRDAWILGNQFCCECNLCSLIACPEDLDPKEVCAMNKREMRERNITYPRDVPDRPVHGMIKGRRTPLTRLFKKLGLTKFTNKGPLSDYQFVPERVVLPLRQHVGASAVPIRRTGERVRTGDVIADVNETDLGVPIHSSMDGVIGNITQNSIEIVKG